jgi:hypothetical protein
LPSAAAEPNPHRDVASIDWTLLQAAQDAYDRVRDGDDYAARDKASTDLVAAAESLGPARAARHMLDWQRRTNCRSPIDVM